MISYTKTVPFFRYLSPNLAVPLPPLPMPFKFSLESETPHSARTPTPTRSATRSPKTSAVPFFPAETATHHPHE